MEEAHRIIKKCQVLDYNLGVHAFSSKYMYSFCAFLLVFTLSPAAKAADGRDIAVGFDGAVENNGIPRAWKLTINSGHADADVVNRNNMNILHIKCIDSSFSLEHIVPVDPADYNSIIWTWKAVRLPESGDVRKKRRNDQALQLLVGFENKKVLSYVWDTNAPEGTVAHEHVMWPISVSIAVIVVESGAANLGKWVTQTRNIYEDYEKFFNEQPPRVKGVRVQSNTQHTRDTAEGYVRDIIFSRSSQ